MSTLDTIIRVLTLTWNILALAFVTSCLWYEPLHVLKLLIVLAAKL